MLLRRHLSYGDYAGYSRLILLAWGEMIFPCVSRSMGTMATRGATHAGSWYSKQRNPCTLHHGNYVESELSLQLDRWLAAVPEELHSVKGARVIIAP